MVGEAKDLWSQHPTPGIMFCGGTSSQVALVMCLPNGRLKLLDGHQDASGDQKVPQLRIVTPKAYCQGYWVSAQCTAPLALSYHRVLSPGTPEWRHTNPVEVAGGSAWRA